MLPRDEVARAINAEVKAGRGSPHGGVFLDIASRRDAAYVKRRLPSMYHQFMELAGVDITRESMEVGPTSHYVMGGVRVDPDTAATAVPGLFAAGEVAAGLHGANRLGGNSLSDLLVFGRRAGLAGAEYAGQLKGLPAVDPAEVEGAARAMLAPFGEGGGDGGGGEGGAGAENPYAIHADLQECMQDLVGIIRTESELLQALEVIGNLKARAARVRVTGNRHYNPAWHLALDLPTMLTVSEACTRSALLRKESRGGHTREDFPQTDPQLGRVNVVTRRAADGALALSQEPLPEMPAELQRLIEEAN